ncbi:RNA polymerase subunit sigma-24 [candidate division LCP-89 bacterium B3_LCP]|uniref:RNA polymerase sigma factor n=1 Tax=candidate division LCP-89 bacterium B3_LCP TaxID=2012998 RepID=A0A532UY12_UNCL8|nr:MAG: RNA polymerase subunit sigma-24 [candidate division LCP-89 bacterium B3_LCP]
MTDKVIKNIIIPKTNSERITDERLIADFQNGDLSAFEEIVYRYQGQLINFVGRLLNDRIAAEDIVQETFLRVYRNKHRYREIARFSTWIYTIAGNLARTELRRRKIRNFFSISQRGDTEKDYEIPDTSIDVEKQVERKINKEQVMKAITTLPVYFREVIILRDVQDLSYEEISNILKVPLGTVKSRVNRGRTQIQKKLKGRL